MAKTSSVLTLALVILQGCSGVPSTNSFSEDTTNFEGDLRGINPDGSHYYLRVETEGFAP